MIWFKLNDKTSKDDLNKLLYSEVPAHIAYAYRVKESNNLVVQFGPEEQPLASIVVPSDRHDLIKDLLDYIEANHFGGTSHLMFKTLLNQLNA